MKTFLITAIALFSATISYAQMFSVGTNLLGWASLGTANVEVSSAVARHLSIGAAAAYNPWTFRAGDCSTQFQNRSRSLSFSLRWWPWYVFSGWWLSASGQWMEYNCGGIVNRSCEEGVALGGGLSAGYTLMIHRSWNLDMSLGLWGGMTNYTLYDCPMCGRMHKAGLKPFVRPDDVRISVIYIF